MQGLFNMTSDSHLFRTRDELERDGWHLEGNVFTKGRDRMLPLYEAKMLHHYDHRWATYDGENSARDCTPDEKLNPHATSLPRYWVSAAEVTDRLGKRNWKRDWMFGWRDLVELPTRELLCHSPSLGQAWATRFL